MNNRPPPPAGQGPSSASKRRPSKFTNRTVYGVRTLSTVGSIGTGPSVEFHIDQIDNIRHLEWKLWYAWFPVKDNSGQWHWLSKVYRRMDKLHFVWDPGYKYRVCLKHFIYATDESVLIDTMIGKKHSQLLGLIADHRKNLLSVTHGATTTKIVQLIL